MSITKNGVPLLDLDTWGRLAGPKTSEQWKAGRSAMEVARAWIGLHSPRLPVEIEEVLTSHHDFGACLDWAGEPEVQLRFDAFASEPRNTDLLLVCHDQRGEYLLAIEAKADESFADLVSDAWSAAVEREIKNPRSNGVARIHQLITALLSARVPGTPRAGELRYQLLTAAAGALAEAERRKLSRTVLLIQEFVTDCTDDSKHATNAVDLARFLTRLSSGQVSSCEPGRLFGPFKVPGKPLLSQPSDLYVAKVVRNLRALGAK